MASVGWVWGNGPSLLSASQSVAGDCELPSGKTVCGYGGAAASNPFCPGGGVPGGSALGRDRSSSVGAGPSSCDSSPSLDKNDCPRFLGVRRVPGEFWLSEESDWEIVGFSRGLLVQTL